MNITQEGEDQAKLNKKKLEEDEETHDPNQLVIDFGEEIKSDSRDEPDNGTSR